MSAITRKVFCWKASDIGVHQVLPPPSHSEVEVGKRPWMPVRRPPFASRRSSRGLLPLAQQLSTEKLQPRECRRCRLSQLFRRRRCSPREFLRGGHQTERHP